MSETLEYTNVMVCVDCYFAHHYGVTEHDGKFYAGESDTPADRKPLGRLEGFSLSDNTCSNHRYGQSDEFDEDGYLEVCNHCGGADDENGIDTFSMSACQGCGSHLGGSRYRLSYMSIG